MDPNKFYCRNAAAAAGAQSTTTTISASSIAAASLSIAASNRSMSGSVGGDGGIISTNTSIGGGGGGVGVGGIIGSGIANAATMQEYLGCGSSTATHHNAASSSLSTTSTASASASSSAAAAAAAAAAVFSCKELMSRNNATTSNNNINTNGNNNNNGSSSSNNNKATLLNHRGSNNVTSAAATTPTPNYMSASGNTAGGGGGGGSGNGSNSNTSSNNSGSGSGGTGAGGSGGASSGAISNGTGNYINVMPVAVGTLQYHRRKLTPQDYQPSRLYYNTTDYRCRDDYYTVNGGGGGGSGSGGGGSGSGGGGSGSGRLSTAPSPSPSLQLQSQHQQSHHHTHQQQQSSQQQQQHQHHSQTTISQQTTQHYHHHPTTSHYHQHTQQQQQQQQQSQHTQHNAISHHLHNAAQQQQLTHHHQNTCSPSVGAIDCIDEAINCGLALTGHNNNNNHNNNHNNNNNNNNNNYNNMNNSNNSNNNNNNSGNNGNRLMAAATQTNHNLSLIGGSQANIGASVTAACDQLMSSAAGSAVPLPGPTPIGALYTVHRVVTTAQIQTAVGANTFASSSSVSSVVSAVRNEADCMAAAATAASAATINGGCLTNGGAGVNMSCIGGASALSGMLGDSTILNNNSMAAATSVIGGGGSGAGNGMSNITGLRNQTTGLSTNTNFLPHTAKCTGGLDAQQQQQHGLTRSTGSGYSASASASNSNYANGGGGGGGAKSTSSSIPRPLQNVIPTCVYLMSRVAVHMEIEGTAQCPTQVMLAAALGCEELGIANKLLAQSIFGLWMTSALLEIQLKSHHKPYVVRVAWPGLLEKFSTGNPIEKKFDEPMIMLRRNVFFSKRDEEKIKDHRILELLYEEAKQNVLSGRYVMEPVHSLMLGGIQARIELGPYNSHSHTISFFRENQSRFLPPHVAKSSNWSWLPVSRKNSAEVRLLEQFKRVPQTATTRKLMRKYLEFCWALPFYGAAFFHGQVEQPVRGLMSLVSHKDVEVTIAVNERGVYIIDPIECTLLLGLRYEDLSWDFAKPSANDDPECLTCIFIQFDAVENGMQISKLMQIFSKQAAMIDALISHFAEQMRKRKQDGNASEQFHDEPNPIQNNGNGVLCNKLSRLTLATFDEEGRCIGQMGSLSISY